MRLISGAYSQRKSRSNRRGVIHLLLLTAKSSVTDTDAAHSSDYEPRGFFSLFLSERAFATRGPFDTGVIVTGGPQWRI